MRNRGLENLAKRLSTPSLGITTLIRGFSTGSGRLSTPSLGITFTAIASNGFPHSLSTPSLGITEPDSGIIRLSAAFCRGAPSQK
jgi:hypothetical protein